MPAPFSPPAACPSGCRTPAFGWLSLENQTSPSLYQSGLYATLAILFVSLLNTTSTGTIFATVENATGSWAGHFSGNLTLPPNASGWVKMPVYGLQLDSQYTVNYYAAMANGVPISGMYSMVVYASESSPLLGPEPLSMLGSSLCNVGCPLTGPFVTVAYRNTSNNNLTLVSMHGVTRQGKTVESNILISRIFFSEGQTNTFTFGIGGLAPGLYTMSTFGTTVNGSALSGTSVIKFQIMPNGLFFIGDQTDFTLVRGPTFSFGGTNPFVETTYANSLNFTVTGIVFLTIHNSIGQTVAYSTATLVLPSGGTGTAYDVVFGLPPGTYYATVFVISVSWVAISTAAPLTFTIS